MPQKAIDWNCGVLGCTAKGNQNPTDYQSGYCVHPYLPINAPQERF